MRLVNLTNRTVCLYDADGTRVLQELPTEPPAPIVDATIETIVTPPDLNVPIVRHQFKLESALPAPQPGTLFVVGWPVLQALIAADISRPDLVAPDTARGSAVRDAEGRIIGVRRFRVA